MHREISMNERSTVVNGMEPEKSSFFDLLKQRAKTTLLCIDLQPVAHTPSEALSECKLLIHLTKEYAAAYKPIAAYFEVFGAEGWNVLRQVIAAIPPHIPCILDAKRGDVPSASEAYARSAFQYLNAHAITVSPYLGSDTVECFSRYKEKGVWVVCKTSKEGSKDVQCLPIKHQNGKLLYEVVAEEAVTKWGAKHQNVGLVVGGMEVRAVASIRARAPLAWLLLPEVTLPIKENASSLPHEEVDAAGVAKHDPTTTTKEERCPTLTPLPSTTLEESTPDKELASILRAGIRPLDNSGILIGVGTAISRAKDPRQVAKDLVGRINEIRFGKRPPAHEAQKDIHALGPLAAVLMSSHAVQFGRFQLKSGKLSPIHIDLRGVVGFPVVMKLVAREYAKVLKKYSFDRIAGIPYAGLPFATAAAMELNVPLIYPRKEGKESDRQSDIEGNFKKGEKIVILDDLISTGETKMQAIQKFREAGLEVVAIVVLIDREMGGKELFHKLGCPLEAVAGLHELVTLWEEHRAISHAEAATVRKFLEEWKRQSSHL